MKQTNTQDKTLEDKPEIHYNRDIRYYDYAEGSLSCNLWEDNGKIAENNATALEMKLDVYAKLLDLKKGENVCEIGSGLGTAAKYLSNKHQCYIDAVTISESQADSQVDTRLVNHHCSDWKDWIGKYDKVYSDGCLVHAKRCQQEFFNKMFELTKPGGICLIKEMFNTEPLRITRDQCNFIGKTFNWSGEYKPIRKNLYWAKKAGFTDVQVHKIPIENYIKTMNRWHVMMRRNKNIMRSIDPDQYALDYLTWSVYIEMMQQGSVEVGVLVCRTP